MHLYLYLDVLIFCDQKEELSVLLDLGQSLTQYFIFFCLNLSDFFPAFIAIAKIKIFH